MPRTPWLLVLAIALALHAPTAILAQDGNSPRLDRFGDPLPIEALTRLGTVRFHRCTCAAYSPDGKIIATADSEELNLWDVATSNKIRRLQLEKRWRAVGLIFSHDGKKLAVIGESGTSVQLWDLDTFNKTVLDQPDGGGFEEDWSNAAAFSRDNKTLFAATSANLFVWDLVSGKKLKEFPFRVMDQPIQVRMLTFSNDGTVAATRSSNKVQLWDTQTGRLLHEVAALSYGETMRFSRDGKTLVVTGSQHWMNIFSVETGKKLHSLAVSERVASVAFSPDGKTLAAASNQAINRESTRGDHVIQLWDLGNLQAPPVKFPAPGIHSVMFSPDGKTLAWGCHGQTLCFMDPATGKDQRPTASHSGAIKSLVYLPDGKRIVSASEDGTIRIWDATTGESLSVLNGHVGPILGMALYPNGKLLASCGQDGTFRLWDIERGKALSVLKDEGNGPVAAAAFSADGQRLASGGHGRPIFMHDPATGKIIEELDARRISSLAFSPDGKTIAGLGHTDRKLLLQDVVTNKWKEIPVEGGGSCVAYSPDGKMLAAACNGPLLLLDTATNSVLKRLPGQHTNWRGCVVFSPDGRYLASVCDGWGEIDKHSIHVFELATATDIYSFKRELPIFAAAFSPDGSKLAVGGADATALILDLKNLTGKKRREQLTENELLALWESLGAADAGNAYEARADLLHAPKSAVPFLAKRLEPGPAIDAKRVESLIQDLDSDTFKVRDQAFKELGKLGELVGEHLRNALTANLTEELRQRLQSLLGKLNQPTPIQLQNLRGIEILEGIGTPEALKIIERLTQGNADGLQTIESFAVIARRQKKSAPLPGNPIAQEIPVPDRPSPGPVLPDLDGDPMPAGAIARLGSARWRLANEPRRIIVSADGKTLAVVNSVSGVEMFDSQTGRCIERARNGFFSWGFDMSVALSADWRQVTALEDGDRSGSVLALFDRGKAEKVKIEFRRKKESYPLVPEEVEEDSGRFSTLIEYLSAADFSPDGKTLVGSVRFQWQVGGNKVTKNFSETHLVAWNTSTGKEIWKSLTAAKVINAIMFSPEGKTITVVDKTGIGFWDVPTGRELRRWQSKDPIFSACYSPDRNWLATGSMEEILLWEVATGKVLRRLAIPWKAINEKKEADKKEDDYQGLLSDLWKEIKVIAFSPDGKILAGGGYKTIRFWDPLTGKSYGDCSAFPNRVKAVAFSSDGKTLFSGHEQENVLRRWDVVSRKPFGETNGPIAPLQLLSFSRDSRTILASSTGEDFYLWEAATGKPRPLPSKDDDRLLTDWLASSGQAALLSCESEFGARFAMLPTGKIDRLDQLRGILGSSVDGQRFLIESEKDKKPCLTVLKISRDKVKDKDKHKGDVEREFVWKEGDEVHATLSPDGKTVAGAGQAAICFFDVITGQERRYEHPTNVNPDLVFQTHSIKFSADGSRIALVGSGGKIRILAVKDGRRIAEFTAKPGHVSGVAFSPDGQTLLTTRHTGPTPVHAWAWEVATGQMVRRLEAATNSYVFSPDNRMLAGSAGTLKVFNLYSGRVIRECKSEGNVLGTFAFSPNSKLLAASCSDTTILVWPTSAAAARAGKPLDEKNLVEVLEKGSATDAYEAIGRMIADPERALSFLERRLHSIPKVDAKRVQRLIDDLDSDQANRREAATNDLVRLGTLVEPALRVALSSEKVPLGSKKKIEKYLHDLDEKQPDISAEEVLHIRAIQALERIGTKRARQLLETLAQGAEASPRTRAAVEALSRMEAH